MATQGPKIEKSDKKMRINQRLAELGIASRREADTLIDAGLVLVNGKKAVLGLKVNLSDVISFSKNYKEKKYAYFAYHKPTGIVTTNKSRGEKEILDVHRFETKVFPVGRLDKDSSGLILMTNDGRVTKKILSPEYEHQKEYEVTVDKPLTDTALRKMSEGVVILDGYKTKKTTLRQDSDIKFTIILTEGKNRQIRRMAEAVGYKVKSLKRIRVMDIKLGTLPVGAHRSFTDSELKAFLTKLKIPHK